MAIRDILDGVDTLRGTVRVTMELAEGAGTQSIAGYLAIRTPDAARFTYIGPFGIVLFEAVTSADTLTLYLPQQMTAYTGARGSDEEGAEHADFADTPFSDLFGAFTTNDDNLVFFLEHRETHTVLYGISPVSGESEASWEIAEKVIIDRETMRPVTRERFAGGVPVARTAYEDFQERGDHQLPGKIVVEDLVRGQSITITLSGIIVNEPLTDEVFDTTPEDPWTIMPLDQFIPPTF
jgi:outer membrane lipoprotein-sorting protein